MMKIRFSAVAALAGVVLVWGAHTAVQAAEATPNYLGDYCWTLTITDTTVSDLQVGATFILRFGVTYMGGSYYSLQGIATFANDGPYVVAGSGVLQGSTIHLAASGGQDHVPYTTWRDTSKLMMALDASTLNGTFYDIGSDFNTSSRAFDTRYTAGNAILTSCP